MQPIDLNTILVSGVPLVALIAALTEAVKGAICGDDDAARQRFGPTIAVVLGALLSLLDASAKGEAWQGAVIVGAAAGAATAGGYWGVKATVRRARGKPARHRHAVHHAPPAAEGAP